MRNSGGDDRRPIFTATKHDAHRSEKRMASAVYRAGGADGIGAYHTCGMLDPSWMIAVYVVVAALFAAGLAGAVLPFVPGPLLIFVGALVYAAATGFSV